MAAENHWAVLVAGSNTYSNYRHQSDVHHAYQIMKKNGIPEEQIILMSYDDIAQNYRNPLKGQIFNHPNGENVYFQSDISYSGAQVTTENFLAVLKGDAATAGGPVLKSDSNSKVFVYFADHGSTGFVCMPTGKYLYADQLQDAIDYMEANNMYDELVFYIEACESGSMFPNLTDKENVYAMTASNASLSSWASYCGSDAVVNGVSIGSCLGDLFSTNWMEDTEANTPTSETLLTQYNNVKTLTTASPVQIFGDLSIQNEVVAVFEGNDNVTSTPVVEADDEWHMSKHFKKHYNKAKSFFNDFVEEKQERHERHHKRRSHILDSRDVNMHQLFHSYATTGATEDHAALQVELKHRAKVDGIFTQLFPQLQMANGVEVTDYDCLRFMVNTYEKTCEKFSDYSLKYGKALAFACENFNEFELAQTIKKMQDIC
jgi:legumain